MSQQRRQRQARVQAPPRRRRGILYALIATVVLVVAGWLAARPLLRRSPAPGNVVLVQASMAGFQPQAIRAKAGDTITVRLESLDTQFHMDGGGRHQFAIDELGVNVIAPPLGTRQATFVVQKPGVYPFYCSICCGGKANPTMWGQLIVQA